MMAHGFQLESARQEATDRQKHRTRQSSPDVLERGRGGREQLRRALQLNDGKVLAPGEVPDREFNVLASTTAHLRLWPCAGRASRPEPARLEPWLATGRSSAEVDLVRRRGFQRVMRSVPVVPIDIQRQLSAKRSSLVGDQQQPSRALEFHRSDEPLDHGDGLPRQLHPMSKLRAEFFG